MTRSPEFGDQRLPDRFWTKVQIDESGCWLWTAGLVRGGYGKFKLDGRSRVAHRVAYETLIGAVPDGLQLDHLCATPACVNIAHLEPVTGAVNVARGRLANLKTGICRNGHSVASEADIIITNRSGGGEKRKCRRCHIMGQERGSKRQAERYTNDPAYRDHYNAVRRGDLPSSRKVPDEV